MIVLLEPGADAATIQAIIERARELDLRAITLDGAKGRALAVSGPELGRALELRGTPGVAEILTRRRRVSLGEPLWPHFALRLGLTLLLLLTLLSLLAGFLPPGLGLDADDLTGAPTAAVEWYLRPPAAVLESLPGFGALLLGLLWAALILMPFLDRADRTSSRGRLFVLALRGAGLVVIVALVLLGLGWTP